MKTKRCLVLAGAVSLALAIPGAVVEAQAFTLPPTPPLVVEIQVEGAASAVPSTSLPAGGFVLAEEFKPPKRGAPPQTAAGGSRAVPEEEILPGTVLLINGRILPLINN